MIPAADSGDTPDVDLALQIDDGDWSVALPELDALASGWVRAAVGGARRDRGGNADPLGAACYEMGLVFTSDSAVRALNRDWRGKDQPTNVLAFENTDAPPPGLPWQLGDVVLALGTARGEAQAAGISLADHAAHLVIHGVLHLFGYDHQDDDEAARMEALETGILAALGIADPYLFAAGSAAVPDHDP